jgi:geranylgeranyl diphosphate synthase type II
MDVAARIERCLDAALARTEAVGTPPRLAGAMRHAVFPGGARIRPRVCLAVARACGAPDAATADAAATAIELLHCASLVHDDLPCFDDAPLRRGRETVHVAYGVDLAVLTGDALIVLAFEVIGAAGETESTRAARLLLEISRSVGAPRGIVAGQAWECEPCVPLADYHRAKTGALFIAAAVSGAIAADADPAQWREFGDKLGQAYQIADDVRDVSGTTHELGKAPGRDATLGRPNAVREYGLRGAVQRLQALLDAAVGAVPRAGEGDQLRELVRGEALRLMPGSLARRVA